MIVLDEQISRGILREEFRWYSGRIFFLKELRRGTLIKDDSVPTLLARVRQPTFLTINVAHFWRRVPARPHYCIVCFDLPGEQVEAVPSLARHLLQLPPFHTKANRMGKVILVRPSRISYYEFGRPRVHYLTRI